MKQVLKKSVMVGAFYLTVANSVLAESSEVKNLEAAKKKYIEAVNKQHKILLKAYDKAIAKLKKKAYGSEVIRLEEEKAVVAAVLPGHLFEAKTFRPFNLSDVNWEKGIARGYAGFFVSNTITAREALKIGDKIELDDGKIRTIIKAEQNGKYLNITLDGKKLSPTKYGYPHSFKAIDKEQ